MTLFKQIALAVSIIIITILASVLIINYQSAKSQMIESMYQTTVNNISTLSQKLAEANNEEAVVGSVVDAEFSSGYYQNISYKSYAPEFTYTQEYKESVQGVPEWFISFTSLELQNVTTEVTTGWNILGELKVVGDSGVIYSSLYKIFIKLLILFIVFVFISLVVIYTMLLYILKPLKKIQNQAEAVINNEFIIDNTTPFTSEFREVNSAMNSMVEKVETIFQEANEVSKCNHELLYQDQGTKLANKRYLLLKLTETIQIESKANGGTVLMAGINHAEVLNKRFDCETADAFFFALGQMFKHASAQYDDNIVARYNGTEFCLVLPGATLDNGDATAQAINKKFLKLIQEYDLTLKDINISIGVYKYTPDIETKQLLEYAEFSLLQAKADEKSNIYLTQEDTKETKTKDQWRSILEDALKHDKFTLKFWSCKDTKTTENVHKVMTFMIEDGSNRYPYGDFIAAAIDLELSSKIYTHILEKIFIAELEKTPSSTYAIRLSNDFLKEPSTFIYLEELFQKYANNPTNSYIFEFSNSFCVNNAVLAKGFSNLFRKYGFKLGINAFTNESSDLNYLKELSPKVLKADVSFLLDLSAESISSLKLITHSLNIQIVATMVQNPEQLKTLQKLGIDTVQGPLTDKL
ncbi:MAG: EAL domain-containing protein [Sulfurimonas sp.]